MTPTIVLFDLDNTLYDYSMAHHSALEQVQKKSQRLFNINPEEFNRLYEHAKSEVKTQLSDSAASHNRLLYFQKLFEIRGLGAQVYHALDLEQTYWNSFLMEMKLRDGVLDFMDELRLRGIKSGLITDLTVNIQFRKLIRLELEDRFDAITTSEEVGHDKPHPDCFNLTIQKILKTEGLEEQNIWMVGDDLIKDIQGAITHLNAECFLYKTNKKGVEDKLKDKITVFDNFSTLINKL